MFKVNANVIVRNPRNEVLLVKVGKALGIGGSPIQWYVQASLNLPLAFDITKRVQISIV